MADTWDPAQYGRFRAERSTPFFDLVGLVRPPAGARVADLGCGTAELTRTLLDAWPVAEILAVDASAAMLAFAPRDDARLHTLPADIGALGDVGTFDVIVANASLHWVPDHARVLTDWTTRLRPHGQLAVQVPANGDHPAHRLAAALGHEWFGGSCPPDPVLTNVLPPEQYAVLLHELGYAHQLVRLQVYGHTLPSTDAVVEWVKGTTLTRFRTVASPEEFDRFVDEYRQRLMAELGDRRPYFYPFKRILFWARRPG